MTRSVNGRYTPTRFPNPVKASTVATPSVYSPLLDEGRLRRTPVTFWAAAQFEYSIP